MKALFASGFLHIGVLMMFIGLGVVEPDGSIRQSVKHPWHFLLSFVVFWCSFHILDD
jgi:hypothetical protein